jgi:dUTP pyrophosphatase
MDYSIDPKAVSPCSLHEPKHIGDAGADIAWGFDFDIDPRGISKIDTGISVDIPTGWVGVVTPRSSNDTLTLANDTGIIDSTYTGNIKLKVENKTSMIHLVNEGERHFQLIVMPHMLLNNLNKVDKIVKDSTRGEGGFGSTGK